MRSRRGEEIKSFTTYMLCVEFNKHSAEPAVMLFCLFLHPQLNSPDYWTLFALPSNVIPTKTKKKDSQLRKWNSRRASI